MANCSTRKLGTIEEDYFMETCSKCGADLKPDDNFCTQCGTEVKMESPVTQLTPEPSKPVSSKPKPKFDIADILLGSLFLFLGGLGFIMYTITSAVLGSIVFFAIGMIFKPADVVLNTIMIVGAVIGGVIGFIGTVKGWWDD
jgi:hypothetical protein